MAITKIWAVKDDLNRVLNYIKNPDKTKEDMSDGLKEVLTYTTQGYKTNEKEFITGINCEPRTALKQMMNTKLSYNKMDGRLAFHAVQSFKPGEVTPEQCHALGVQLAKQMWGNRFEVVVSTHLDKEHLHNHFVVNSVSWVDGKKYDNKKADIDHFRELNDAICKEHGLTVITKPEGKAMNYGEWKAEKNDSTYLRKLIRYDVDSVLLYARTPEQFQSSLEEIGYVVNLNGKHWTLKHPQSKRTFRFYKLTRDNRYDEEHLMERINSNFLFPMQSSVKDVIPCKEYQGNHRKLKGIKAMYIRYCFELGILKPKGIPQKYPSPALRKDLIYMDKITNENTLIGKHNLETIEDVLAFKLDLNNQIENWMNQRRSIYNKIKRTRDPELKQQLEQDKNTLTSKIAHGKKEIRICEDIEKRVPDIEEKLKTLDIQRRQEQLALESMEKSATDGVVYAEVDGVVKTVGDPDEKPEQGQAFLVVTGDDGLYVKGTISELLLDEVTVGTVVTANSWESGMTFDATITEISDYPVSGNSWGDGNPNVSYYEYTAYIEDSSALRNGEAVDLSISTNQSDGGGIFIEKAYVRSEDGKSYCMIADENNRLKKQYVVTGRTVYGSAVEIKSGLTEDDRIAFPYGKNAVEGAAVTDESSNY